MSLFAKVQNALRREQDHWPPVHVGADGFRTGGASVMWRDVTQVAAFKRDMFTVDDVYIEFRAGEATVRVCEEQPGFPEFEAALIQQFPSAATWRNQVMRPAFAENFTILYRAP